jgi:hypothetical protein
MSIPSTYQHADKLSADARAAFAAASLLWDKLSYPMRRALIDVDDARYGTIRALAMRGLIAHRLVPGMPNWLRSYGPTPLGLLVREVGITTSVGDR